VLPNNNRYDQNAGLPFPLHVISIQSGYAALNGFWPVPATFVRILAGRLLLPIR